MGYCTPLIHIPSKICRLVKSRKFSDENVNYFKTLLQKEPWVDLYNEPIDLLKFDIVFNTITDFFNMAFPGKSAKAKPNKPTGKQWVSQQLIQEGCLVRDICNICKINNNPILRSEYNALKKQHSKNVDNAKKTFFRNKILLY